MGLPGNKMALSFREAAP